MPTKQLLRREIEINILLEKENQGLTDILLDTDRKLVTLMKQFEKLQVANKNLKDRLSYFGLLLDHEE